MNPREKILAIAVGASALLLGLWFGWSQVTGMYSSRRSKIEELQKKIARQSELLRTTQAAAARMRSYEDRSLPPDAALAQSLYQAWLLEQVVKAGLSEPQVAPLGTRIERKLFVVQTFKVSGKGKLPQAVALLHSLYSVDYMHRISRLSLQAIKDSKNLEVSFDVEAMSLERAAQATKLAPKPSTRLQLPRLEDYVRVIGNRNLFGPPNQAPRLSGTGRQSAYLDERAEISVRASDSDPLDKVSYKLVKSALTDARLDPSSGRLTFTPKKLGEYEFVVQATDDGLPAKSTPEEKLLVSVTKRPPPPDPGPPPPMKLAFDDAKFTVLSGIIDVSGTSQVWLYIRPRGQTLKLGIGDEFEIGSIKGVVTAIGSSDFTFEMDGKERKLTKGAILETASTQPESTSESP